MVYFDSLLLQNIPFIYSLMSRKTKRAYTAVFKYIHENIIPLTCKSFMTDYEKAMRAGLLDVLPNGTATACVFHFKQAAKRNARKSPALIKFLNSTPNAKRLYYKLLSLPLLPAVEIANAFAELKKQALDMNKVFSTFLNYFEQQWINGTQVGFT